MTISLLHLHSLASNAQLCAECRANRSALAHGGARRFPAMIDSGDPLEFDGLSSERFLDSEAASVILREAADKAVDAEPPAEPPLQPMVFL